MARFMVFYCVIRQYKRLVLILSPGSKAPGGGQVSTRPPHTGAEYRRYEDVGSSEQARCGARTKLAGRVFLETLLRLFKAFGSQHANGATV